MRRLAIPPEGFGLLFMGLTVTGGAIMFLYGRHRGNIGDMVFGVMLVLVGLAPLGIPRG